MVYIKKILKTIDSGIFYLLVHSSDETLACEVKKHIAEELLEANPHLDLGIDKKTGIQEFEFIEHK